MRFRPKRGRSCYDAMLSLIAVAAAAELLSQGGVPLVLAADISGIAGKLCASFGSGCRTINAAK